MVLLELLTLLGRFHVDDFSSAHVYLRTKTPIKSYDELPAKAVIECAQLTKDNSIEGCKKGEVVVIYTWASNLLKNDTMETGAVSFHNRKLIVSQNVEKDKEILKQERDMHVMRMQKEAQMKKKEERKQKENEQKLKVKEEEEKKQQWNDFEAQGETLMRSNHDNNVEDDFW
ncbi:UNKNOWN [Stylonychia lemnae]|uniref:NFACT RNA-binding domain-containing protein n=1 Tax=Stylonychia lemnae TaxID=5949 RepID=A0A078ACV4_STYLE|nr:UNKNOWN [Stylonychia lemnae]|eukprot:CDW78678.1 UNKNOWN [Stylonychia lemnae]